MNPIVEFQGLSKSFRGVYANVDISLKVAPGSIHAIIGENGAGKSTAMKILYGIFQPDSGEIFIDGKPWGGRGKPWSSPADAIRSGIGMVHQHFMLGGPYTALDNILLGTEDKSSFWKFLPKSIRPLNRKGARKRLEEISQQYGLHVDWDEKVENLSVGIQQRIEILKLLYRDAKILILDEPTAVLTPQETLELFANLKKLCAQGKTVLIITHKLKEVMSLADRVTVFRAGRVVGEREIQATHTEDLASLMVGRKISLTQAPPPQPILGAPVLELKGVSLSSRGVQHSLKNLSFSVKSGEVVGIAGVEGNGQSELLQILLRPKDYSTNLKGSIRFFEQEVHHFTTRKIKDLGVGVIPEDRHLEGLLLDRPVSENFLLGLHRKAPFYKNGLISRKKVEEAVQHAIEEYDIRPRSAQIFSSGLSGGNQQKLIISREFKNSPRLLIAAQPTRGVDVGAIDFIHKRILRARAEKSGVLLISSELDEILALSDRILVMYEGKIVAEFKRGEATEKDLGLRMGGAVTA